MGISKDKSIDDQIELIRRGAVEVISEDELRRKLITARDEDRPLRVKLGLDPTAPDIHLGIAVVGDIVHDCKWEVFGIDSPEKQPSRIPSWADPEVRLICIKVSILLERRAAESNADG